MPDGHAPHYPIDPVNRVKRRHDRGHYDHATVHALLDSAALCHVSYVIDGQPYCTPTLFWREEHASIGMAAAPVACCATCLRASRRA